MRSRAFSCLAGMSSFFAISAYSSMVREKEVRDAEIWPVGAYQNHKITDSLSVGTNDLARQAMRLQELRRRHLDRVVQRMIA